MQPNVNGAKTNFQLINNERMNICFQTCDKYGIAMPYC